MTVRNLDALFKPRSIALIGNGRDIEVLMARNLLGAGFKGPVMPVDPTRQALEGILTYRDVAGLPLTPELAVITTPPKTVPALIAQLGERGTRAAVIISEGSQLPPAPERQALNQAVLQAAAPHGLRILGPGSLGISVPVHGLNASLSHHKPAAGQIAFVVQSSAIARAGLDWGTHLGVGFSHLISLGAALDVDFADVLDYLAGDTHSRAILLYLEQIDRPRQFMSAARRAARVKPVIALKPRKHTPDNVDDAVYEAALRRAGILRVNDRHELFTLVETLSAAQPVVDDRLAIVANSHSLSLLAVDTLIHYGGRPAQFSEDTEKALQALVGPAGSAGNPVDLGDEAGAETYGKALDLVLRDRGVDGVLVINAPSALSDALPVADAIVERLSYTRLCILAGFVGPIAGQAARRRTMERQVPTYETADEAVRAFMRMVQHKRNQEMLVETPASIPQEFAPDAQTARGIVRRALDDGRRYLDEIEAMELLGAYGIPMVATYRAADPGQAAQIAAQLGRSVALKIMAPELTHKSQVGGVMRYLDSPEVVREAAEAMQRRVRELAPAARIEGWLLQPMEHRDGAYEITLGVRPGGAFGPVLYFGQGGTEAEVIGDIAYGLPPLNMNLAREMMVRTRIYPLLRDSQLRSVDLNALALTLLKVSQLVIDLGEIVEIQINPLRASGAGVLALDARIRIAPFDGDPAARLAIRPYPKELEETFTLPDGRTLLLRPIRPEDEPALQALVLRAPAEDLRMRFFQPIRELPHPVAARLTQIDYDREMALVVSDLGIPGQVDIYGVVRVNADPDNEKAEYAILVDRKMTGMGLGPMLMRRIINYARSRGLREIYGEVLRENEAMLKLNRALGFTLEVEPDDPGVLHVSLPL